MNKYYNIVFNPNTEEKNFIIKYLLLKNFLHKKIFKSSNKTILFIIILFKRVYKNNLKKIVFLLDFTLNLIFFFNCFIINNKNKSEINNLVLFLKSYIKKYEFYKNISKQLVIKSKQLHVCTFPIHSKEFSLQNSFKKKFFFIRESACFFKGRYSRARQISKVAVYWSIYINIIVVLGVYFWFFNFTLNFGYIWFFLMLSFFTPFLQVFFNFNLINILINIFNWYLLSIREFLIILKSLYNVIFKTFCSIKHLFFFKNLLV